MAVLLNYQKVSPDVGWVNGRVYKVNKGGKYARIDDLSAREKTELSKQGLIVEEEDVPNPPERVKGKDHRLMVNLKTKEFFWETRDRPFNSDELQETMIEKLDKIIELLSK